MQNPLRDSSRTTLAECERVIDELGFAVTTGGELEWYSLIPEGKPHMTRDEAVAQVIAMARENPDEFFNSKTMIQTAPDTTLRYRRSLHSTPMTADDAELLARDFADTFMRAEYKALNHLLRFRVEQHMKRSSITIHKSEEEGGEIPYPVAANPGTEDKLRITGEKLEISTGMTSPTTLAVWLEKMHDIIREESDAIGLVADFRSKPPYTFQNERGPLFDPLPGTSQHVHFGLRHLKSGRNGFQTKDEQHNQLSDNVSQSVLTLLKQGGQLLANPAPEDYDRFTKLDWGMSPPLLLGNQIGARQVALREVVDSSEDPLANIQSHKELRIMGGSTPAPAAVLVPVLGITDALLTATGRMAPTQDWQDRTGTASKIPYLRQVANSITDDDRAKLQQLADTTSPLQQKDEGWLHTSFDEAWASLSPDSAIARYAPKLYTELKQLGTKGVA